jgi:hypothetical protein
VSRQDKSLRISAGGAVVGKSNTPHYGWRLMGFNHGSGIAGVDDHDAISLPRVVSGQRNPLSEIDLDHIIR